MSVTSKLGLEFLEAIGDDECNFMHEDCLDNCWGECTEGLADILNVKYDFEVVDSYGGEDQGSTYYTVWKITDRSTSETTFLKFYGWYASHVGTDYTGVTEVKPTTKTVVVYD